MQPLTLPLPSLETWVALIFRGAGLDEDSAALAAKPLLLADITGVRTHVSPGFRPIGTSSERAA
jgi:LDH2 family malate/lactate/ureidoglycolate dehydrogenase